MNNTLDDGDRFTRRYLCPSWCEGHADGDDPGGFWRDGQVRHFRAVGDATLWQLRNPVSGEVRRDESAGYEVYLSEIERIDGTRLGAFVLLGVAAPSAYSGERTPVEMHMTAGEARSLAAVLTRAADRLELWS